MDNFYKDEKYLEICSEKTLQTSKEGFFMCFVENVSATVGPQWIRNIFGKLKSDQDRLRTIYEYEQSKCVIEQILSNVQEIYRGKNAEQSQVRRKQGEATHDLTKALALFSQGVLKAPPKTVLLTGALCGRAKVLIQLNHYNFAVQDLQLALHEAAAVAGDTTSLTKLKAECFGQMAICYRALGEDNRAKVALNLAEKLLGNGKSNKFTEIIETKVSATASKTITNTSPAIQINKCVSSKVDVKHAKNLGRFAVASGDIRTGDTLIVEPPSVACLLPDAFGTHCHHCFVRLTAPVGCPDCCSVAFCSPPCRDTATKTYHRYECKYLDLLIGSGMSILSHCALRMITQNTLDQNVALYANRQNEHILNLCTNAPQRTPDDFLQRTLMVAFLLRCLQKSGYFFSDSRRLNDDLFIDNNTDGSSVISTAEYQIGELLLYYLQMLQFNAHEIYETLYAKENRFKYAKCQYIGVGIYPTVALLNHACDPCVTRHFVGKNIVIKANRPLRTGDIISENYGPIFTRKSLAERQRSLLARYWFSCQCVPCTQDWPILTTVGLDRVTKRIKCPNKKCTYLFTRSDDDDKIMMVKCPKCEKNVNLAENIEKLMWCEQQYKLSFDLVMNLNEVECATEMLCKALDTFYRVSAPPHKVTHQAQEMLRACFADTGNVSECLLVKQPSICV